MEAENNPNVHRMLGLGFFKQENESDVFARIHGPSVSSNRKIQEGNGDVNDKRNITESKSPKKRKRKRKRKSDVENPNSLPHRCRH